MARKTHAAPKNEQQESAPKAESQGESAVIDTAANPTAAALEVTSTSAREPETAKGANGGVAQVVTRFPAELAARLDRYTERLRNERFGLRVSRADAVRILVHERLAELEAESESPRTVTHKGRTFQRTGKFGTNRATGVPSAEYGAEDGSRVWRDASGTVREE